MATCSLATLQTQACANGFNVAGQDEQLFYALVLQLLCDIQSGGGGGGGTVTTLSGAGSPEGSVTGSPGYTYFNTTDGSFWVKQTGVSTNTGWINIVA